jgi:2',3'-cyclic-nucleotide 2'-phosphodiesterase/3'-nucleotidase
MRSFRALSASLLLLPLLVAAPARAERQRVTLLHTADLHGMLSAHDDLADRPAARGLTRVATLVRRVRDEGAPTLLLDAGDALAGSPLVWAWRQGERDRPEPVTLALRALGYDALTVGNHEFDFGPEALAQARAAAGFPFLAANIVRAGSGEPAFPPALVRDLPGGIRVGILGLTTPATPLMADSAQWGPFAFLSPVEVARREVARLRGAERCDAVVVLAHFGLEKDPRTGAWRKGEPQTENWAYRLATEVPGLDVVVMAHTHQSVPSLELGGALLTQAGRWGEALGRVDLEFERATDAAPWTLAGRSARVIAVGDTVPEDSTLRALIAPYAEDARTRLDEEVTRTRRTLRAAGGRFADNALWQLIHRVQLEATGAEVSLAALFEPAQVLPAGPVRVRDLLRLYPHDNTLLTLELSGADLRAALEHSARYLAPYTWEEGAPLAGTAIPGYQFDMAMGLDYEVDLTRPEGERIGPILLRGESLRPEQRVRVAVNSYRAAGGGDYDMLRRAPRLARSTRTLPELVVEWARRQPELPAPAAAGWTLLPDFVGTRERAHIERLVRLGVAPRAEVFRLGADEPARRFDLAYWIGRAFDWRSARPSGAWADVPESLEVWVDGVLARGVLGAVGAAGERFQPYRPAPLLLALDWSERAARAARYALSSKLGDPSFRRSLVTGTSIPGDGGAFVYRDTLTRAQWLGMLANLRFPTVRVLETTDFHGNLLPVVRDRRTQRPVGGAEAVATWIRKLRAENPEGTVLLDGGDIFQGTMISNLQYGRPVVEHMNALDYTAAAIGNHEFDWTADTLVNRILEMRFTALGANIIEKRSGRRPRWAKSDTTVLRRGVRVGIVGLAYPGTPRVTMPAYVAHLKFEDDSTTAARVAARVRRAGAGLVLGVGHIPAETDSTRSARGDLARLAAAPGVDAWFGGHSHNVVDDRIGGKPVMIAGATGQWLAVCDFVMDPVAGRIVETRQRMLQVWGDEPAPDTLWAAKVRRWNSAVAPIAAQVLGRSEEPLDRRRPEATIGNLICDAMRWASGADIALQNPGGMRADLDAGEVTRGEVYAIMPFDNTIVMLEMTGAEVQLALEQALRSERITQVSGLRYRFDSGRPAMSRVTEVTLADGTPLDPARTYRVAANNFMASGGDQYDALGRAARKDDTQRTIRSAMEEWVRLQCADGKVMRVPRDGRIRRSDGE